jgi:hypothetical protein
LLASLTKLKKNQLRPTSLLNRPRRRSRLLVLDVLELNKSGFLLFVPRASSSLGSKRPSSIELKQVLARKVDIGNPKPIGWDPRLLALLKKIQRARKSWRIDQL